MNRFYVDKKLKKDEELKIEVENFHHCITVLKHRSNDNIIIFDKDENEFFCKIIKVHKEHMVVETQYLRPKSSTQQLELKVYQSIPKGRAIEEIIEKSVELGVKEFTPVISSRTIKRSNEVKKRWFEIIKTSTKQCGRSDLMTISEPISYSDIFDKKNSELNIIFYENSQNRITKELFRPIKDVSIIIGPEGGFSRDEINLANKNGFVDLSLGNTILRSSTALILGIGITKLICS